MNNFKAHIPKPCNEDWNRMSPNGSGRFCGSCIKMDLLWSDSELGFFRNPAHHFSQSNQFDYLFAILNLKGVPKSVKV